MDQMYCMDYSKGDVFFQATLDDEIQGRKHVFAVIKAAECSDESRLSSDPKCSSTTDIDSYLLDKTLYFHTINKQPNYQIEYDEEGEKINYLETFQWIAPMPLRRNKYTGAGMRFRFNEFYQTDQWFFARNGQYDFIDLLTSTFDVFDVDPAKTIKMRGEMYLRMHSEQIIHKRRVMVLMDFLGKIGGLNRLLWTLGGLIIGFLYQDRLAVEIIEDLYEVKDKGEPVKNIKAIDIVCKQVFCCFRRARTKQVTKVIDAGKKKLSRWFDIKKQIMKIYHKGQIGEFDIDTGVIILKDEVQGEYGECGTHRGLI